MNPMLPNMDFQKYEKYITKSLLDGAQNRDGTYNYSKIFDNLKHKAVTTFHQIQTLFEEGQWINDNSVVKMLDKKITESVGDVPVSRVSVHVAKVSKVP